MQQAVAALLAHGADPDARNPRTGDTPLHVAGRSLWLWVWSLGS